MVLHKRFYIFSLVGLICFLGWVISLDVLLLSIWIVILLILISSYLFSKQSLSGVNLKRISRVNKIEAGNLFDERIEIKNDSRTRKLWIQIEDQSEILSHIHSRTITNLGAGRVRLYQARVMINQRGFYALGPTRLVSGDPFGIFTISKLIPAANQLLVYPHIDKLPPLAMESGIETGGQNLIVQTTRATPQAAGVREYQPGDPLNRIHWPITVKKDRLMVKEFDEDTQSCVWLFLDAKSGLFPHASTNLHNAIDWNLLPLKKRFSYKLPCDGFEYAVSVAASLADYYTRSKFALGFACIDRQLTILPAEKSQRQFNKVLKQLATVKDNGDMPLQKLIERQIKNISHGSTLVLITGQNYADLRESVSLAERRGLHVKIIQIDAKSFASDNDLDLGTENCYPQKRNLIRIAYKDEISSILK